MNDIEFNGAPADKLNNVLAGKTISKISEDNFAGDKILVIEFNDGIIARIRYDFIFNAEITKRNYE